MQTARNAAVDILSIEDGLWEGIQPDGALYKAALEIWQEMNKYAEYKGLGWEGEILGIGGSLKKDFCSLNVAPDEIEPDLSWRRLSQTMKQQLSSR